MIYFAGEDERRAEIQAALGSHFEFAERSLKYWLHCEKERWLDQSPLSDHVLHLAMMLNIQAMRLFRTVTEESHKMQG